MLKLFTRLMGAAAVGAIVAAAAPASAATTSADLGVSATVSANCALSTLPVAFGTIDATSSADTTATGSISVTCTSGTAWSASADAGQGTGATLAARQMTSGSNLLSYALYTDSTRATVWGDAADSSTALLSDTGTGTAQTKTVYGTVPGGQTSAPAGDYADTVSVTVTY